MLGDGTLSAEEAVTMHDVVICEPVRTPVGGFGGALASLDAAELATLVVAETARRAGLGEGDVDDVILGNCNPSGEFPALGRIAAFLDKRPAAWVQERL